MCALHVSHNKNDKPSSSASEKTIKPERSPHTNGPIRNETVILRNYKSMDNCSSDCNAGLPDVPPRVDFKAGADATVDKSTVDMGLTNFIMSILALREFLYNNLRCKSNIRNKN